MTKRELIEALIDVPDEALVLIETEQAGSFEMALKQVGPLQRCSDKGGGHFDSWSLDDTDGYREHHPGGPAFDDLPYSVTLFYE